MRRILTLTIALLAPAAAAQHHPNLARGYQADKVFDRHAIDAVNTFNGNLTVNIPIGQAYPAGERLSYGIRLQYNARLWDYVKRPVAGTATTYLQAIPNRASNAGMGWQISLGRLLAPYHAENGSGRWVYESPSGSQHVFYDRLHHNDPQPYNSLTQFTRDGTYLRFQHDPQRANGFVEFPDGTQHHFDHMGDLVRITNSVGNNVLAYHAQTGQCDSFGCTETRQLTINANGTHTISYRKGYASGSVWRSTDNWYVESVDLAGVGATRRQYGFAYDFVNVARGCQDDDPTTSTTVHVAVLKSVTLPDGTQYNMSRVDQSSDPCTLGLLSSVQLPTRGTIKWDYTGYAFPNPVEQGGETPDPSVAKHLYYYNFVPGVSKRSLVDGTTVVGEWTYNPALVRPTLAECPSSYVCYPREMHNTVRTPNGDSFKYFYNTTVFEDEYAHEVAAYQNTPAEYGLPYTRRVNDGTAQKRFLSSEVRAATNVLRRTNFVKYEYEVDPNGAILGEHPRVSSRRIRYDDDGGIYADTDFASFDGLGNYREVTTGGNFPGGNTRYTLTGYSPSAGTCFLTNGACTGLSYPNGVSASSIDPWILNTYTEQQVSDTNTRVVDAANGSVSTSSTIKAQFCFDRWTGNLLRVRRLSETTPSGKDLLTEFAYDFGNRVTERYFGGDKYPTLPTTGDLCSISPGVAGYRINHAVDQNGVRTTSRYSDDAQTIHASFYSVNQVNDPNTGSTTHTSDIAGLETNYEYDMMGRITFMKPRSGHDGQTQFVYAAATSTTPAVVTVRRRSNSGSTVLSEAEYVYDAFGRLSKERHKMPGSSWSERKYEYNAQGWLTFASEADAIAPASGTRYSGFDPFGRPSRIEAPDYHSTTNPYAYTTLQFLGDREIRRTSYVRTSGNATTRTHAASTTNYIYDRHGRIFQVKEPSGTSGGPVTTEYGYFATGQLASVKTVSGTDVQYRVFTYDGRGLLWWEQHPEIGNGSGSSPAIGYAYDAGGNVFWESLLGLGLEYQYDLAERLTRVLEGSMTLKSLTYYPDNRAGFSNGKLWTATRNNDVSGFIGRDITVTETYSYLGRGGRPSSRVTDTSEGPSFSQSWTHNELGNVDTLGYPACTTGCPYTSTLNVPHSYDQGFLTGVSGWANAVTYHPNGLINRLTFGDNTSWNQQNDANKLARPLQIYTANSSNATTWATGIYKYDGSGNVATIGSDYYTYDLVGRVLFGSAYATGGNSYQQFTHDAFGNIKRIYSTVNSTFTTRTLNQDSRTNRVGVASYDIFGRVTVADGVTYTYDRLHFLAGIRYSRLGTNRVWAYAYTADDERVLSLDHTGNVAWWRLRDLDGKVLTQFTNGGSAGWTGYRSYVYRGRTLLGAYTPYETGGPKRYFAVDHLGTPRRIVDSNGSAVMHHYFPYGEEVSSSTADQERMKFTGHERDLCCDGYKNFTDNMHARQYSPLHARFMRPDPVLGNLLQPQSWNRYAYVLNNPIRYIDPYGLDEEDMTCDDSGCTITVIGAAPSPWFPLSWLFPGPPSGGGDGGGGSHTPIPQGSTRVEPELRKAGECIGNVWHSVESVFTPFVAGQAAMLGGAVLGAGGAFAVAEGTTFFIPSFGITSSAIAGGGTAMAGGAYLYFLGAAFQIDQINNLTGLSFPSPSHYFPAAFPTWPSATSKGSHSTSGVPCRG